MGITLSIAAGGGIVVAFDWGAVIALGVTTALGVAFGDRRNNVTLNYISDRTTENLSGREELSQTIYKSKESKNYDEPFLIESSSIPYNNSLIYEPNTGGKKEGEEKIFEDDLFKYETNELNKSLNIGKNNNYSYKNTFFTYLESKDFENYVRNKQFPSSSSPTYDIYSKTIGIFGQEHITNLLIEKTRNRRYYLNWKNKKILDQKNFNIFREKNLNSLHQKVKEIRIFKKIMYKYDMIEKTDKICRILMDEDKKNSHKVVEVGAEAGKIAAKNYFVKKYFIKSLRATQKGVKNLNNIYKSSKIVKTAKFCVKGGSIGTGIVITLIADALIEETCNLTAEGLKKVIDKLEDEK